MIDGWINAEEVELRLAGPSRGCVWTEESAKSLIGTTVPTYIGTPDEPTRRRVEDMEILDAWLDADGWICVRAKLIAKAA